MGADTHRNLSFNLFRIAVSLRLWCSSLRMMADPLGDPAKFPACAVFGTFVTTSALSTGTTVVGLTFEGKD
jgi:hypothetical protein